MIAERLYMWQVAKLKGCPRCAGDLFYDTPDEIYCVQCGYRKFMGIAWVAPVLAAEKPPREKKIPTSMKERGEHGRFK